MKTGKTLIRDGMVVDGTGKAAFRGDVLLEGEKISAVAEGGFAEDVSGDVRAIDASGMIVSPGFIDSHSHSDAYLIIEPGAPSKISQGITTEINGQCGGSAAPRYGEARLSSDWASLLADRLVWRSLAGYRDALAKAAPAINTVQFAGHNTLRSSVVGYAGRPATEDELKEMARLLEKTFDEGAWGLTTGLIYQPGKYASDEEVVMLARTAANAGRFYSTHMRSEGDRLLESIDEVAALAEKTGVRSEISHLKTSGRENWNKIDAALEKIESYVSRGVLLGSDRYPFTAAGTDLDVVFPDWAGEGAAKAEIERLAQPAVRSRIEKEIDSSARDWRSVMIGGTWHPETKRFSGMTLAAAAAEMHRSPGEAVCFILEKDLCRTGAFFFTMCEENLDKILSRAWIVPGSDASLRAPWGPLGADHPHPRAYSTMPEFFNRLKKLGFSKEEAVKRMTCVPAERFGISRRGRIEPGFFADIAVWREEDFRGTTTYATPHSFSAGMEYVFVNGALSYAGGKSIGRAGQFLEPTANASKIPSPR